MVISDAIHLVSSLLCPSPAVPRNRTVCREACLADKALPNMKQMRGDCLTESNILHHIKMMGNFTC